MRDFRARAEALGKTEEELRAEMAASLGRIGRKLEELLLELMLLKREIEAASEDARADALQRFSALRESAELHLWYRVVQREAMGIRGHEDLRRFYPIPGPLRTRSV